MTYKRTREEVMNDNSHPYYYRPLKEMIKAGLLIYEDGSTVVEPLPDYVSYLDHLPPYILNAIDGPILPEGGITSCGCAR